MSEDRTIIQEEGDRLVAAEYVLGVLGPAQRRKAQHLNVFAGQLAAHLHRQ